MSVNRKWLGGFIMELVVLSLFLVAGCSSEADLSGSSSGEKARETKVGGKTAFRGKVETRERRYVELTPEHLGTSESSPDGTQRRVTTVAVLDFENKGPSVELAKLGAAVSEMLVSDLSGYLGLQVVERSGAGQLLREKGLAESGLAEQRANALNAQELAADFVIAGSFKTGDQSISMKVSLLKVDGQKPVVEWDISGPTGKLLELEQQLARRVTATFGLDDASRRKPPTPAKGPSPTVAILAMKNLGPFTRLREMESGIAEILQASLSAFEDVRLVEREDLDRVLDEQKMSLSGLVDPDKAIEVGRLLKADRFISGSFLEMEDELRLQVRLVDTETATVLASESVIGKTDQFSDMLEDLTVRLVADLAVQPPVNARELVQASLPARKLEAAIHCAKAELLMRQGKLPAAADSLAQAVVVEPKNVRLHYRRVDTLYKQLEFGQVIHAGYQALGQEYGDDPEFLKWSIYVCVLRSCRELKRFEEHATLLNRVEAEYPKTGDFQGPLRYERAEALIAQGRRFEGVALLEKAVEQAKDGSEGEEWYDDALFDLYKYHMFAWCEQSQTANRVGVQRTHTPEQSKQNAARAVAIFEQVLQSAEGKRDASARRWGLALVSQITQVQWVDEYNRNHYYLTTEQQVDFLRRGLKVFGWISTTAAAGNYELAEKLRGLEKWQEAIEAYQCFLDVKNEWFADGLPCKYDTVYVQPGSMYDKRMEVMYSIAKILHDHLGRKQEALRAYQQLVHIGGVAHARGPATIADLHKLEAAPEYPENAVLIWGGAHNAHKAWSRVLGSGYVVHSMRLKQVTPAILAPYRLVILVRPGYQPYCPNDYLALRSYVATGGSLLVVVSAGWEPALPGILNPLLSFFDARADDDSVVRAGSTRIAPHPITGGIRKAMAKNAVGLHVPADAALIEAGDKIVLAAMPYRHGRVVIASFGQWFLPDPTVLRPPWTAHILREHWTYRLPTDNLPIETGDGLQLPLLSNVVTWLAEEPRRDDDFDRQRKRLRDACQVALKVRARALPWESLSPAMDRLVSNSVAGVWREEALWVAGESFQHLCLFARGGKNPLYGVPRDELLYASPKYYEQIIKGFPESALVPYAQWRLGECERRKQINENFRQSGSLIEVNPDPAIALYGQVRAAEGSYAWAWTHLRIGMMYLRKGEPRQAAAHFRQVSERMHAGAEKSLALLNLAACYQNLDDSTEARRCCEALLSLPDINWSSPDFFVAWAPLRIDGATMRGGSKWNARRRLHMLER